MLSIKMKCSGSSRGCNIFPMGFQDQECFADVNDVKFWILFFHDSDIGFIEQMRYCCVKIVVIFAP